MAENRTLLRGLRMLELLGDNPEGLALSDIARRLDMPKSSAFPLIHTLADLHYAEYSEASGRYRLGLRMFEVGSRAVQGLDALGVIRSHMRAVHGRLNETMHLGVPEGLEILYIDKLESTRSIRMSSRVGLRMPMHLTAMGKAALSCLSDAEVRALYPAGRLEAMTDQTVPSVDALLEQLERVRARGYAVERGESNENVCCAAVAIRGRDGRAAYALSISAPAFRFSGREEEEYGSLLAVARREIEGAMRWM